MSRNFIVAIKTTYRTISYGETHCRRKITEYQTCHHDQQFYRNEYKSYLLMVESQQLNIEVIFCLAEVKDI